uniref:Nonstructural protein 1 n=1 Tax=Turdus hortulorum parvoviridae sp. TaxID=2794538 RepID=A0A8A4XCS5_9VIRU|nr:MAG: nonstructural protein 1 [Turdus hortulorum parvoviridae sp.]
MSSSILTKGEELARIVADGRVCIDLTGSPTCLYSGSDSSDKGVQAGSPQIRKRRTPEPESRDDKIYKKFKNALRGTDISVEEGTTKKVSKAEKLYKTLKRFAITNRTQFSKLPEDVLDEFLLMPNLESVLPKLMNQVAFILRVKPFVPVEEAEWPRVGMELAVRVPKIRMFLCGVHAWSVKYYRFFGQCLNNVLNLKSDKQNCIWVWGPSNTGKTTLMESLVNIYFPSSVGKPDNNVRSNFPFNNCVGKRLIFWEEPYITPENIENVKCLMSGSTFAADVKYQSNLEIEKTPVLVTSNKVPWAGLVDQTVMRSRCFSFKLATHLSEEWLKDNATVMFPFVKNDWEMFFAECCLDSFMIKDDCKVDEYSHTI